MSWLFDRLCDVALADEVGIVIATEFGENLGAPLDAEFAEFLVRASRTPRVCAWLISGDLLPIEPGGSSVQTTRVADSPTAAASLIGAVTDLRTHPGTIASATDQHIRIGRRSRAHDPVRLLSPTVGGCSWVVATDKAGLRPHLELAAGRGLGIAVSGLDPGCNLHVTDPVGLVSIVDALLTLREFAFAGDLAAVTA